MKRPKRAVSRKPRRTGSAGATTIKRLQQRVAALSDRLTAIEAAHREAADRENATNEILRAISRTHADVQPVFDAIARSARRLCAARTGIVHRFDGTNSHLVALAGGSKRQREEFAHILSSQPVARGRLIGRALIDRETLHIPDIDTYADASAFSRSSAKALGWRSGLFVPMVHEGTALGAIVVTRAKPEPFSPEQITLLQTFADQGVIAIQNARLFKELEQRNRDLTTALEQQTATADILRMISQSQTDVRPVFDTIVQSVQRLLRGHSAVVTRVAGNQIDLVAFTTTDERGGERLKTQFPMLVDSNRLHALAIRERAPVNIEDTETDPRVPEAARAIARARGYRSQLMVPMLLHDTPVGSISVSRSAPGGFTDDEVALLRTFADQAVIAIENVRLFKELRERTAQLQIANAHKDEFLANMSHELRTPLNSVIGFSEVLLERLFGEINAKQEEYLNDVLSSARHLLSLINDILDLSKIEAGKMELDVTDFDVPIAIDNALTLMRERAARRAQALTSTIDPGVGTIRADERKVKQILLNLLSNAVKFTPEGGRIIVAARLSDGAAAISVTDTGVGIAPEHQALVFEEFRQVGQKDKKAEGTGLGLALCRKFVELHGGRIWLTSEVSQGSTFTFTIPVGGPPGAAPR